MAPPRPRHDFERLGPGLVTGAADDDPSGIASYSQVGAQYGYALGWALLFSLPLMIAIQLASARIGLVTGNGIAGNMRDHLPRWLGRVIVCGLLAANIFNIGADLSAMGDAVTLIVGGPGWPWAILAAFACVTLEIVMSYRRYAAILKFTTFSLLAYVAVVLIVHVPWSVAIKSTMIPSIQPSRDYGLALAAILGTTISPYLFFWQAGQEVEEEHRRGTGALARSPAHAVEELQRLRFDTVVGMTASNVIALFIVFATAATLHAQGITAIATAAQAAEALRPLAGPFAFALFALGILGTGFLAIPVLAGSAAYAVAEMADKPEGLDLKPGQARTFYGVIAAAVLCGLAIQLLPIPPMTALYWAAILNGLLAAPIMAVVMWLASSAHVMGRWRSPLMLRVSGWIAVAAMTVVALGALV